MELKVKIEADGLEKAIITLAQALSESGISQMHSKGEVDKPEEIEQEKLAETEEKPKEEKKKQDEAPKISLETVRVKLAELNSAGKGAAVRSLIAEYDSSDKPKLSNVSEDDYAELLEKAAKL